jgi:Protein of unknown function (DUF2384)
MDLLRQRESVTVAPCSNSGIFQVDFEQIYQEVSMTTAARRAEIVARDEEVADRFRGYLESLDYTVEVKSEVEPTNGFDVDVVVYHVSPEAAKAERRRKARPGGTRVQGPPRFWLDALRQICERAPDVPILVAVPPGADAGDKALDSGATDVIDETATPRIFRHRLEMLHTFFRFSAPADHVGPGVLDVPLPSLRHPGSGRIHAGRVATYLGVPLRRLADAMQAGYAGLHKTPDAPRVQEWLRPVVRALELADAAFGSDERVRMWLNHPLHELEDESPLAVILAGEAGAVETLLENARSGIPG